MYFFTDGIPGKKAFALLSTDIGSANSHCHLLWIPSLDTKIHLIGREIKAFSLADLTHIHICMYYCSTDRTVVVEKAESVLIDFQNVV